MRNFARGEIRLLVATTVIEVRVDVSAAGVMVIEHAERFGLAQLHQLRGRVGRGTRASSCLLLYDEPLTASARARLEILRASDDGFRIAEEDLRLRGPGEMLGTRQSGLPALRLADLTCHADLLGPAREDARRILGLDPGLQGVRAVRSAFCSGCSSTTTRSPGLVPASTPLGSPVSSAADPTIPIGRRDDQALALSAPGCGRQSRAVSMLMRVRYAGMSPHPGRLNGRRFPDCSVRATVCRHAYQAKSKLPQQEYRYCSECRSDTVLRNDTHPADQAPGSRMPRCVLSRISSVRVWAQPGLLVRAWRHLVGRRSSAKCTVLSQLPSLCGGSPTLQSL